MELAQQFFSSGQYFWNSGIFVWHAKTVLNSLKEHKPALYQAAMRIADAWDTPERMNVLQSEYAGMEKISVDYAIMEKARDLMVLQTPYKWDDVGSWMALERLHPQDSNGNTVLANHVGIKTGNSIVVSDNQKKLITTIGVNNLLIVQDGDALLVADKNDEAGVKLLVETLRKRGMENFL